ncbi:hypothetical protein [Paenibacillus thermotolerans]|uniref:hypothetical protein n=1 Tax=Paenibacillus thermotolerans TaxID=3027807 RepID=UPI002368A2BC|nr:MULTISPECIES: hypothetical protein [unclassified Paenibacillus]
MTFELSSDWMSYAMWAVLGVMVIDLALALVKTNSLSSLHRPILGFLQNVLYHVFPLYLLVNMAPVDPTNLVLTVLYYVGAAGAVVHYLYGIKAKL